MMVANATRNTVENEGRELLGCLRREERKELHTKSGGREFYSVVGGGRHQRGRSLRTGSAFKPAEPARHTFGAEFTAHRGSYARATIALDAISRTFPFLSLGKSRASRESSFTSIAYFLCR